MTMLAGGWMPRAPGAASTPARAHGAGATPSTATPRPRDPLSDDVRPIETEYRPRVPIDALRAIAYQQHGAHDPTQTTVAGVVWRAIRSPQGVATIAIRPGRDRTRAAAWGPGAEWALAQLPRLCGADDDPTGFDASRHPLVADVHRRHPGLRIGATDLVFDALASAIFEQKVTGLQAFGAWRRIVARHGERAPGPTPRPMFAPPADWAAIPSWSWHRAGLEPPQSRAIVDAAARRTSIERATVDAGACDRVLTSLRGVGAWTSAETRIRAFGDRDAVSVGDYHLAHQVGYALTGSRVDDDGMLELLEPWRGHRQRIVRIIGLSGAFEPRRGPRMSPEDHRAR